MAFALGLMCKPTLVTLPFVLLLLDYWPLMRFPSAFYRLPCAARRLTPGVLAPRASGPQPRGVPRQPADARRISCGVGLLVEKLPLLALAAASCVVTLLVQSNAMRAAGSLPLPWRLENAAVSYAAYLRQWLYPAGLAAFYPHPRDGLPTWEVVGACLLLALISAVVLVLGRRYPHCLVGWFWYVGMLVPAIGIVQVGRQAMADRYTYLPQIGLSVALAWTVADWAAPRRYRRWIAGLAGTTVVLALIGCTWRQAAFWRNSASLWNRILQCSPRSAFAELGLGKTLAPKEAIAHFQRALDFDPQCADAYDGIGNLLHGQGRIGLAIEYYEKALAIDPRNTSVLSDLGAALYEQGHGELGIEKFRRALEFDPELPRTERNLAWALQQQGNTQEAVEHYRKALAIVPLYADAHRDLGTALIEQGEVRQALDHWRQALRLQPENLSLLQWTAWVLATYPDPSIRNGPEALGLARRAAALAQGKDAVVLDTLAAAYAETGQFAEAVKTAEQAVAVASTQHAGAGRRRHGAGQALSDQLPVPDANGPLTPGADLAGDEPLLHLPPFLGIPHHARDFLVPVCRLTPRRFPP